MSDEFSLLLEDYHYGEIEGAARQRVAAHLRQCAECSKALGELEAEDNIYRVYADNIETQLQVSPDSWAKIQQRIAEPVADTMTSPGWLALAWRRIGDQFSGFNLSGSMMRQGAMAMALVIVSITGTLVVVRLMDKRDKTVAGNPGNLGGPVPAPPIITPNPPAVAVDPPPNGTTGAVRQKPSNRGSHEGNQFLNVSDRQPVDAQTLAMRKIQHAQQEYVEAIQMLNSTVNKHKKSLDPQLVAVFERNLRMIDENISDTRKAYLAHPKDVEIAQYMLDAYAKKVELLQDMAGS